MANRRDLLKAALGSGVYAGLAPRLGETAEETADKRPNFIFICADDLGWGDVGVYGHPEIQTPHMDRLASQGTIFTQHYVGGPVCSPSRAAYVTGLFPARTQILRPLGSHAQSKEMNIPDYLDPAVPTVMGELKKAGYATGHFGKWHLTTFDAPDGPRLPPAYGVDDYKIDLGAKIVGLDHYDAPYPLGRDHVTAGDRIIFDDAIQFVEKHRDQPFYMNVWSHIPHIPLYPSQEDMAPFHYLRPNDPWPAPKQVFYAAVSIFDANIGRLLARLDELGLAENTVVVVSSDHGPENVQLNEDGTCGLGSTGPFRGHKVSLYEGGIRVPFIARWPGRIPSGRVESEAIIAGVDLLPTFSRMAQVDLPSSVTNQLDGEDMTDVFLGTSRRRRKTLYWENRFYYYGGTNDSVLHRSPILAIREGDWKLLMNPHGSRKELYHIPNDPSELNNKMDTQAALGERLAEKLMSWFKSMPGDVRTNYVLGTNTAPGLPLPEPGGNTYPWPTAASVAAKVASHKQS